MPISLPVFDDVIVKQLIALNPKSILDMGAGNGKYSKLLRSVLPECKIDAVEATKEYIDQYGLNSMYDTVYNMTIEEYLEKNTGQSYDVVIFGDVLEHMYFSKVTDYLDFLLYRTRWILCVWPTNLRQDEWCGNGYECHRSNFKLKDLSDKFEVGFYTKRFVGWACAYTHQPVHMHYCVLKGLPTPFDTEFSC